jgi:hypothetical protein
MQPFKVICKIENGDWAVTPVRTKIVTTRSWFGLIRSSKIVADTEFTPGPQKNEECIVVNQYPSAGEIYYHLAGYPYGGYDSRYFVRIDEFIETEKEIAEKSQPILN